MAYIHTTPIYPLYWKTGVNHKTFDGEVMTWHPDGISQALVEGRIDYQRVETIPRPSKAIGE